MATLKHIASKNSDYTAIEAYLVYQHDAFTGKQLLDELARRGFVCDTKNGRIIKDKKQLLDLWVSNYNEVLQRIVC